MLFPTESVTKARRDLVRQAGRGKLSSEDLFQRTLELDPLDYLSLVQLGRLRSAAGDKTAAEQYAWRAVNAQPCHWAVYLDLGVLLQEQQHLADGLTELGLRKVLLDGPEDEENPIELPPSLKHIDKIEAIIKYVRDSRKSEPAEVTARLRPYRLIHEMQEAGDLDAGMVDTLLAERQSVAPLLVGVLRAWAQDYLSDDDEHIVENALALLGEIGDSSAFPHLLEFMVHSGPNLAGAAGWACDRIAELNPEAAAREIARIAPCLDGYERMLMVERIVRKPEMDSGTLLERMAENLSALPKDERDRFVPVLCMGLMTVRLDGGAKSAGTALFRCGDLLSRKARVMCEELIDVLAAREAPLPMPVPSEWTVYDICAGRAVWDEDEDVEEEGEDDEFSPVEPIRREALPGRNDPCWCGSGKKYKKCHLDTDQAGGGPNQTETRSMRGELDSLRKRLSDFFGEIVSRRETKQAFEDFFEEQAPGEEGPAEVIEWMLHDWVSPQLHRTVMQEYLRRHGAALTSRERELVESWSRSFVSLFEIQNLTEGSGLEVKDMTSGEVFFVHDVNMSKALVRWDGLLARVVDGERGREFCGLGLEVPRSHIEPLRQWMEEDRAGRGEPWPEYLKNNLPRIRRRSAEIGEALMESLQLANTDGEELLLTTSIYRISDKPALIAALRDCPELMEHDDAHYVWMKGSPGDQGRTVLGNIQIQGDELTLECNSRQRHERGRRLLSGLAGKAVRHVRDKFKTQETLKRAVRDKPKTGPSERSGPSEIPPEVRYRLIQDALEQHYEKWVDMPLPALGGKTPRQAAKSSTGRPKLIALLRDFENGEEQKRRAGEPHYDIGRLRAKLGVRE